MQDRAIDNALLALQRRTLLSNLEGLDSVETLLRMRGVDLSCRYQIKPAARGKMTKRPLHALAGGPKNIRELASSVDRARPEIGYADAYKRTGQVLAPLNNGAVGREGRLWCCRNSALFIVWI